MATVNEILGRGVVERQLHAIRAAADELRRLARGKARRLREAGAPPYAVPLVKQEGRAEALEDVLAMVDARLAVVAPDKGDEEVPL